ncbi:MAG: hypothetical protein LC753_06755 [Acidobacteria bacterium]|nr:hypothetical protein [Acidobacteriota bacterium]MCA1649985.1 hypothetical protein [Acidobacteriota bacterium]
MKRQWITTAICVMSLSLPSISLAAQHPKPPKAQAHAQKNKGNNASKQAKHANKGKHKGEVRGASGDQMRFQGLDKNRDGMITRSEWQGDDRSFANHDWNSNGVLWGDELRPGATKPRAKK